MNKVLGGTPIIHSESRCTTCRWAQIVKGISASDVRVYCRFISTNSAVLVRQPVYDCNSYDDRRMPSRYDMEQIAWVLVTDKLGRKIGFMSAEEFRRNQNPPGPPAGF